MAVWIAGIVQNVCRAMHAKLNASKEFGARVLLFHFQSEMAKYRMMIIHDIIQLFHSCLFTNAHCYDSTAAPL